jgi:hypothetical protein
MNGPNRLCGRVLECQSTKRCSAAPEARIPWPQQDAVAGEEGNGVQLLCIRAIAGLQRQVIPHAASVRLASTSLLVP